MVRAEKEAGGVVGEQRLSLSAQTRLGRILALDRPLLDVTLDQLRTFIVVRERGSALKAAQTLGREQSSIQKQLDTLNHQFEKACGEVLTRKQGRGRDCLFTGTAEALVTWSMSVLGTLVTELDNAKQRLGRGLRVGTTEFTLGYFADIWPAVHDALLAMDVNLTLLHVRTRHFWEMLEENRVDLLCGGVVAVDGKPAFDERFEFLQLHSDSLALLTNLTAAELPSGPAVSATRLRGLPLVLPESGVIVDFVKKWYGEDYRRHLTVAAEVDDIYYGLALLRLRLVRGVMLMLDSIVDAVMKGRLPIPLGTDFRKITLASTFTPKLELVSGVVGRRGERERYSADHPLNIVWRAFEDKARSTGVNSGLTAYGNSSEAPGYEDADRVTELE